MKKRLTLSLAAASVSMFALAAPAFAATISSHMDIGTQNSDVRVLQQTLATDPSLYPQGLVTGYFGSLTAAAVQRFQSHYGIVSSGTAATTGYGRVGPATVAKFNEVYGGLGTTGGADSAAIISGVTVAKNNSGTSLLWNTNENATGLVYYSTSPLQVTESSTPHVGPGVTGSFLSANTSLGTSNSLLLPGLAANTTYYYMIQTRDTDGNISVTWPSSFTTNQQ